MVVIIIEALKAICIGEDMTTGIISIDHTWDVYITTGMSTTSGTGTTDIPEGVIGINSSSPLLHERFSGRFTDPPQTKGFVF